MNKLLLTLAILAPTLLLAEVSEAEYQKAKETIRQYNLEHISPEMKEAREAKEKANAKREAALRKYSSIGVSQSMLNSAKKRAEIISKTERPTPEAGIIVGRKAKSSMQERINLYRDKLAKSEEDAILTRDVRKAAKKAAHNLDKVIKTIEQAIKKSSTDEEVELYNSLLLILTTDKEEN